MTTYSLGQGPGTAQILKDGQPMTAEEIIVQLSDRDAQAALAEIMRHVAIESQDWNWLTAKEEADEEGADTLESKDMQELQEAVNTPLTEAQAAFKAMVIQNLRFPAMLRKMWSGTEVNAWLASEADRVRSEASKQTGETS